MAVIKTSLGMFVDDGEKTFDKKKYMQAAGLWEDFKWRRKEYKKRKAREQGEEASATDDDKKSDKSNKSKKSDKSKKSGKSLKLKTPAKDNKSDEPEVRSDQDEFERSRATVKGIERDGKEGYSYQYDYVHKTDSKGRQVYTRAGEPIYKKVKRRRSRSKSRSFSRSASRSPYGRDKVRGSPPSRSPPSRERARGSPPSRSPVNRGRTSPLARSRSPVASPKYSYGGGRTVSKFSNLGDF